MSQVTENAIKDLGSNFTIAKATIIGAPASEIGQHEIINFRKIKGGDIYVGAN